MGSAGNTIITIVTAVIGVAILAVIVSKKADTSNVITSAAGGFSNILKSALSPII